jgi:hypothetical protein
MLDQLRGRNLAHVGCTIGLTLGLLLGLIVGIAIIYITQRADAATAATFAWLAITFGLGALGYFLGVYTSRRLWGDTSGDE